MPHVVVFEIDTLRIVKTVACTEADVPLQSALPAVPGLEGRGARYQLLAPPELVVNDFVSGDKWMIKVLTRGLGFAERPKLAEPTATILADGIDRVRFKAPEGTKVFFQGEVHLIDDGFFLFRTVVAGVYRFTLLPPFPHAPLELQVTANGL